jgi:hypothetical protein
MAPGAGMPQMSVMGDDQVSNQAQQGNLVPAGIEPSQTSDGFPMQMNPYSGNGSTGM